MFGFFETGFESLTLGNLIMIGIGLVLIYLAISKEMEPLLLLPIGFGAILANLPLTGLTENGGLLEIIFRYGIEWEVIPPLIFLGLGALTDFEPLLADPKTFLLGFAAQIGIFISLLLAILAGFSLPEACSIGIIGGADGPTTIYVTQKLAPHLLGGTAVAAYSYMAMVPLIQPPVIRVLTSLEERKIVMKPLRKISKQQKILFPIIVGIVSILFVPKAAPLIGMFMLGNLFRESGVVERLSKTAQNELMNILTIFLGIAVGSSMTAENFLKPSTLLIFAIGIIAFTACTATGIFFAKLMNLFLKEKINPLIGAAGVSAVPMSARVVQREAQKANPQNFLLMHAMGPNVAGVIGSAIVAGVFLGAIL
ncbi:MAG: glutaconyl-CoA decarboxylase subunit beta [Candidatus Hecatellales archaeon]|nr:MAG: glutaconyl-CoA decarboxylase subunit beta [Candidatus Hecatellales archaeon]